MFARTGQRCGALTWWSEGVSAVGILDRALSARQAATARVTACSHQNLGAVLPVRERSADCRESRRLKWCNRESDLNDTASRDPR